MILFAAGYRSILELLCGVVASFSDLLPPAAGSGNMGVLQATNAGVRRPGNEAMVWYMLC